MAGLTGQRVKNSYEQLLIVDNDGGGLETTLVTVKDGDGGTTFPLKLSTTTVQIGTTSGNQTLNIASHDLASYGLKLAGTLVTASATELNIMDGSATTQATVTLAGTDGVVISDVDVMKQSLVSDFLTYMESNIDALSSLVTVGTITSGTWEGTTVAVDQGGTGATSLSNLITLTTHTTGNYVATITGGTGVDSTAATSGEGTTHTLSVDLSEVGEVAIADGDYIAFMDATDSNATKKEALADVATLFAGAGLTASSSVIAVDADQSSQITSVGTLTSFRSTGIDDNANALAMTIDSSERVGIGQSTPIVALDVHHNPTAIGNDTGGGEAVLFGSGSLTAGKMYYLNSSGAWTLTDANAVASGASQLLGIALGSTPGTHGVLIRGFYDVNSYLTGTFVQGGAVYVSETTTGNIDVAAPAGSSDFVRIVGYGTTTANVIYFNPSSAWVEIA